MQRQNGFTLVEIMMVIAIIGILAAIAVPSYQRYIHAAKAEDLLTHIYALREKTAIANNTGDWPANLQSPAHEGIWPDGVTFNPGMLQIEHFKTQISIVDNNRPLAVFIATDADGRFIVDEVRKHLPEHLIHGYFNRTLIGVWLLDKQVSTATTAATTYTQPVLQPLPQPSQPAASQASAAQSATVGSTQTSQPTIPQQSSTTAATTQVVAQQSTPPPVQTSHVPVVSIPAECLKPNGGYYHRNPHRPNCPL